MSSERSHIRSAELWRTACGLIPGGSQTNSKRPHSRLLEQGRYPALVDRASGCRVWDPDGNEYIDYLMGMGPIILGYAYPEVDEAVLAALDRGTGYGLPSPLEAQAAEALCRAVPCAEMVRFLKTGAEATSAAARIARAHTGRERIAQCGYHGWHDQWMAPRQEPGVPLALREYTLPFTYNRLETLEKLFADYPGEIAAVMLVATQVEAPDSGYLAAVRDLARENGALLIFDEIVTGFRMARGGAQDYFGVTPDLACFAKAMANGMPLAAVVGPRELMAPVEDLVISTTYGGETLALAALIATAEVMTREPVQTHLWAMGERLMKGLNEAARNQGVSAEMIGYPCMPQLRFGDQKAERVAAMWETFLAALAERGVLTGIGRLWFITYSHTEEDVEATITAGEEAFAEVRRELLAPVA